MKKILLLFLFIAFAKISIAQELYQDKIHLKNGEIVKGTLVNEVLNVSATIVNQRGDTLTFQMGEIQKLTRENINENNVSFKDQWLKPGYELTIETGLAIAVGEFGINYFQADVINGVRLTSNIFAGFGIGLTYMNDSKYDYYERPKTIVPIYLDLRINYPSGKKFSPYLAFDFGGSFNKAEKYSETGYEKKATLSSEFVGVFLKSTLGTHIRILENTSLNLAVGFRSQKMPFTIVLYPGRNADGAHTEIKFSNSINIIAGITF